MFFDRMMMAMMLMLLLMMVKTKKKKKRKEEGEEHASLACLSTFRLHFRTDPEDKSESLLPFIHNTRTPGHTCTARRT